MSKLFNTLEQIRRNESYQVSGSGANSSSNKDSEAKRKKALFILTVAVACFAVIYFVAPLIMNSNKSADSQKSNASPTAVVQGKPAATSTVLLPAGNPAELNNIAAQLIEKDDHWRGIYLLESITSKSPEMVEPFINLSVALAELGLFEPAKRYLKEAMRLDPENQALLDNLTVLIEAGVIDGSFGPKIDKDARQAGRSWFNSQIPENDILSGSIY